MLSQGAEQDRLLLLVLYRYPILRQRLAISLVGPTSRTYLEIFSDDMEMFTVELSSFHKISIGKRGKARH